MNMAQGVGLHREFLGLSVDTFTMEIRRRVWWTLFIFDSAFRLTFGRPTLSLGGINTRLPRNLDDNDLTVDLDELPPSGDALTITSSLIWQVRLAEIGNKANEKLVAKHIPDQSSMLALGEEVVKWASSLPDYMGSKNDTSGHEICTVPRMVLLWRSIHLRIIIHRPYLLDLIRRREHIDLSDHDAPASRCFFAADECVLSLLSFISASRTLSGSLTWYACYWLVTAVFVHVICLLYEPQHQSALHWRRQIEDSKVTLKLLGSFEPTAVRAARMLENLMGELVLPDSPSSSKFSWLRTDTNFYYQVSSQKHQIPYCLHRTNRFEWKLPRFGINLGRISTCRKNRHHHYFAGYQRCQIISLMSSDHEDHYARGLDVSECHTGNFTDSVNTRS